MFGCPRLMPMTDRSHRRVFVAGHRGLVGSALVRALEAAGYPQPIVRTRADLDLLDQQAVRNFFRQEQPDAVLLAAAKVGGIGANNALRWSFIYENLMLQNNVVGAALDSGTDRLVFFGSSCIYPKHAPQPIQESDLLTGPLEYTNEPYAIAKIAGIKLVEAANAQFGRSWGSLLPTNLYGPGDNFDLNTSHVLPGLIRKFHDAQARHRVGEAAIVTLWGTGSPLREFLHVDDLARAAILMMESGETGLFNVGYGSDLTIRELARMIARVTGYEGEIAWDDSHPDGTPRKLIDSARIRELGWNPQISLQEGIAATYEWYVKNATVSPLACH